MITTAISRAKRLRQSFDHIRSAAAWPKLFAIAALLALTACSKTIQWEEEVPLNAGGVISVKREVTYRLEGAGGNLFDIGYRPDWTEQLSFDWKGKKYRFAGDAQLILLAIAPQGDRPVLVARASDREWHWAHNYRCTTPFYVQFLPAADGREWSWPPSIEPWLFGLTSNLMVERFELGREKLRYSAKDRAEADEVARLRSPSLARIEPTYKSESCVK